MVRANSFAYNSARVSVSVIKGNRRMDISFRIDWIQVLNRLGRDCDIDLYTLSYLRHRFEYEGVKLLTVTLPKLAKAVIRSVEIGYFDRPTDFAWQGCSLRYFRSLLVKIFCRKTGRLLSDYCPVAFYALRQFCEYFYKLGLDFEPEVLTEAQNKYLAVNKELAELDLSFDWSEMLRKNAETFYADLFKSSPSDILAYGVRCGPGSFAGAKWIQENFGVSYNEWKTFPDELTGTCSRSWAAYSGYGKPYPSSDTRVVIHDDYKVAEVLFVKKDSRGPRVISKEPYHLIRPQMAFFSWASKTLERVTQFRINFVDQTINQRLACEGSASGKYATLDLKDASDRVSITLLRRIFQNSSGIRYFLNHLRSTHFVTPRGRRGVVTSVAGMGSGLTFPLLAFLVQISICTEISKRFGLKFSTVRSEVFVYGDDVVVPTRWVSAAVSGLEKSGLLVNRDKSFSQGPFRESCGGDFIGGIECAPTRLKLQFIELPKPRDCRFGLTVPVFDGQFVKAIVAHTHELRRSGLNSLASYLEHGLEKIIPMPYVGYGSAVLGRYTWDTSLIYGQTTVCDASAPDGYIKGCLATPALETSRRPCPRKYLTAFLKRGYDKFQWLSGDRQESEFGSVPRPRHIRLRIRKVSVLAALPATT